MTTHAARTRFVVLSMPRTGSSMLTERLSTHPDIRCFPAIFSATGWYDSRRGGKGLMAWIADNMDPEWEDYSRRISMARKLISQISEKSSDKRAVGFKHHLSAPAKITELVLSLERRKILLTRNNFLAAWSSHKITEMTRESREEARPKVTFNSKEFSRFRTSRKKIYSLARSRIKGAKLEIDYTEARTDEGIARVARFLGVDPEGLGRPKSVKRNSDDIVSRFENQDAVWAFLRRNSLEMWAIED